jgi:hypothetical protein
MVSYPSIIIKIHIRLKWSTEICQGAEIYYCSLEKRREQSLHSVCSSLLPLRTNTISGCLVRELQVSLSKA